MTTFKFVAKEFMDRRTQIPKWHYGVVVKRKNRAKVCWLDGETVTYEDYNDKDKQDGAVQHINKLINDYEQRKTTIPEAIKRQLEEKKTVLQGADALMTIRERQGAEELQLRF